MNIGILGHFAVNQDLCDGQTVKTRTLKNCLERYTKYNINTVDTFNWKKNVIILLCDIRKLFVNNEVIIMLPARNGVKVFSRLFVMLNRKYNRKIYYDVIGGWLPDVISSTNIAKYLKQFNNIWVETKNMAVELRQVLNNILIVPNFKDLKVVNVDMETRLIGAKKFCTFSRVVKKKGISDAIKSVTQLSKNYEIKLDIYGAVDNDYEKEFYNLIRNNAVVEYKGIINPNESIQTLGKYYALLFPTQWATEGLPGTIVDCLYAGLPMVSSRWNSFNEILDEGVARGYELGNSDKLTEEIENMINLSPEKYKLMVNNCIKKSEFYTAKNQIELISKIIEKENYG